MWMKNQPNVWKVAAVILGGVVLAQGYFIWRGAPAKEDSIKVKSPSVADASAKAQSLLLPLPDMNAKANAMVQGAPQSPAQAQRGMSMPDPFDDDPMALSMPDDPFSAMKDMVERMDAMMSSMRSAPPAMLGAIPPHGLHSAPQSMPMAEDLSLDKDGNYVLRLDMPGVDKSQVKAEVKGGMLLVSGTSSQESKSSDDRGFAMSRSYSSSQFHTAMPLPGPVKADKLKIDSDPSGITIKIPKA